ncbi:MAG: S-layer homology domain-containing protein [Candidatus Riflebacteria bacterium]|nr:S-layer homology domain-containing protein [Candidatus Riflebacteria bacterium]
MPWRLLVLMGLAQLVPGLASLPALAQPAGPPPAAEAPAAPSPGSGGTGAFRDVPPDHWAFQDIEKLAKEGLIEGYPDGTFKGKKVVTRYDLAVVVAKMLDRIGQLKAAGGTLSPEETLTVQRLTNEYRAELDLLGVRVESLEKRVDEVERKADRLDQTLSNVRMEGFYRLENTFVARPFNFVNYPFDKEKNSFRQFKDVGLEPLSQEAFLRFIGQPYLGGGFFKDLEAFLELKARISGPTIGAPRLVYRFSDPPLAGDTLDDFATSVEDEQRVSADKAHFKLHAKRLDTRAFSNESMTDFTDPAVLLTVDSYGPFSGLEGNGSYKKLSYNASVLKNIELDSKEGNNDQDLTEFFQPVTAKSDDVYAMRILYEPYRSFDDKKHPNHMILGATYVEDAYKYTAKNEYNRVLAADIQGGRESRGYKWDVSLVGLRSDGPRKSADDDADRTIDGSGFKADGSYQFRDLTISLKGYRFGKDFRAPVAQSQFVDTSLPPFRDNFARRDPTIRGEQLARAEIRYDFKDKLARVFEDLTLSTLFESKYWEDNIRSAQPGTRARVQVLADFTDKTHSELSFEHQEDHAVAETGTDFGNFSLDIKLTPDTSAIGTLDWIDDHDAIDATGHHYAERGGRFTLNSQLNKILYLSGYVEYINNALLRTFRRFNGGPLFEDDEGNIIRPLARNTRGIVLRPQRNGLDLSTVGGEANLKLTDKISLKTWAQREDAHDDIDSGLDGITELISGELGWQFTRALRLRYIHSLMNIDLVKRNDDYVVNNFLELLYEPTPRTELRLTYGYEYENPDDRWDDGPLLFYRTNKIIQLRGQTDF